MNQWLNVAVVTERANVFYADVARTYRGFWFNVWRRRLAHLCKMSKFVKLGAFLLGRRTIWSARLVAYVAAVCASTRVVTRSRLWTLTIVIVPASGLRTTSLVWSLLVFRLSLIIRLLLQVMFFGVGRGSLMHEHQLRFHWWAFLTLWLLSPLQGKFWRLCRTWDSFREVISLWHWRHRCYSTWLTLGTILQCCRLGQSRIA